MRNGHSILTDAGNLALLAAFDKWAFSEDKVHKDFASYRAGFVDGLRAVPKVQEEAGYDRVKELINA